MARPDWINRAGGLEAEENRRLREYEYDEGLIITDRPTLSENADRLLKIFRDRPNPCRWWRADCGKLVDGEWIESPAVVLSKHEERS